VQLTISGEQTELDKTVMEKIGDPLLGAHPVVL
jgi:chemotaxis protein histidine kinase CheA